MTEEMHIHMGTLTRPHGIKGEICVDWYADSPDLLRKAFFLQAGKEAPRLVQGARVRMHQGRPMLTLPGIADRTAAEGLRGLRVLVAKADLPPPDEDEVYLHDILGLTVVDHDSGKTIGVLTQVEFPSEQDVWVIHSPEGKEILFPAVEQFIVSFDLQEGQVRISPPPGLLDLYLTLDNA